ncbi:MAG: CopG family transcriptional regulator [Myxococcota bacterium]|jgi:hypothetical protein|nr:CopG family transcriptional regulator [Myxococcota bacterium]
MARTRRAQVLLEPREYAALERLSRHRGISVSNLIREAVVDAYLPVTAGGGRIADEIAAMNVPVGDWEELEREIEEGHDAGLP